MNIKNKRILITGGSSGIGLALAHSLLAKGAKIVVTGRRPDVLTSAVRELQNVSASAWGVAANVATTDGRASTIKQT